MTHDFVSEPEYQKRYVKWKERWMLSSTLPSSQAFSAQIQPNYTLMDFLRCSLLYPVCRCFPQCISQCTKGGSLILMADTRTHNNNSPFLSLPGLLAKRRDGAWEREMGEICTSHSLPSHDTRQVCCLPFDSRRSCLCENGRVRESCVLTGRRGEKGDSWEW